MIRSFLFASAVMVASPASAAVVGKTPHGFEIRHEVVVPLAPAKAWARTLAVGSWWSDDHTFSGKAANMSIDPVAGGCFCEKWGNGSSVQHLRINYIDPGKRLVMAGALGPLMFEGVAGVMDLRLAPEGEGSKVTMTYRAGGFARGNGEDMAPLVDRVLGEQMERLAKP